MSNTEPEDRLRALGHLDRAALSERWVELHGSEPPRTLTRDLLVRGIAYGIQEQEIGGLSPAEMKALMALAQSGKGPTPATLKAGTRLYREWQGITHEVLVFEAGYGWRHQTYDSLSQVARAITGTRWSGPRFFGVRRDVTRKRRTESIGSASRNWLTTDSQRSCPSMR